MKGKRIILMLAPVILFLLERALGMNPGSFAVIAIFVILCLGIRCNAAAMKIYYEIGKKYNYYPQYWVQGPGRISTFSKTQEYLKRLNDTSLVQKMDRIAYMESTIIYVAVETIGLLFIDILI